jgi:hypothetical protein
MNKTSIVLIVLWPALVSQLFFYASAATSNDVIKFGACVAATIPLCFFVESIKGKMVLVKIGLISFVAAGTMLLTWRIDPYHSIGNFPASSLSHTIPIFAGLYFVTLFVCVIINRIVSYFVVKACDESGE